MVAGDANVDEVRDILRGLVEGPDMLDDHTIAAIARGEEVNYDTDDTGAALDLTQLVHLLQVYVPIVAGMLSITKTLKDFYTGQAKVPTAEEIAAALAAFAAKYDAVPPEVKKDVPRIAQ